MSSKYEKFKEKYPVLLAQGLSKTAIMKILGISRRTFYNYEERYRDEMGEPEESEEEESQEEEEGESEGEPFDMILMKNEGENEENDEENEQSQESFKYEKEPKEEKKSRKAPQLPKTPKAPRVSKPKTEKEGKDVSPFPRRETITALDKSYAVMIEAFAERQKWFSKALEQIGMDAMLMAMQLAKIPPRDWYDKIQEFHDVKSFIDFVEQYLVALFEAKEDASRIIELRDENNMLSAQNIFYETQINVLNNKIREMVSYLNAALSMLNKEQIQKLFLWNALYKMQNTEIEKVTQPIKIEKKEDEENE